METEKLISQERKIKTMANTAITIEEKRDALYDCIHGSIQALEAFSDLELLEDLDNYEAVAESAEETIYNASDEEIDEWYEEWCYEEE